MQTADNLRLKLDGTTAMTGNLNMNYHDITWIRNLNLVGYNPIEIHNTELNMVQIIGAGITMRK